MIVNCILEEVEDKSFQKRRAARKGLWSLARTSRWYYDICSPIIYNRDAKSRAPFAFAWGAVNDCVTTVPKALAAGTEIDALINVDTFQVFYGHHFSRRDLDAHYKVPPRQLKQTFPGSDETDPFTIRKYQDEKSVQRLTALHLATAKNNTKAMKWLLDRGASLIPATPIPWFPIGYAVWYGHVDAIQLLLKYGDTLDKCYAGQRVDHINALHIVAGRGHVHLLDFITKFDGCNDPDNLASTPGFKFFGNRPLHYAVLLPHRTDMMMELVKRGVKCIVQHGGEYKLTRSKRRVSVEGCPLVVALGRGYHDRALCLLKTGAYRRMVRSHARQIIGALLDGNRASLTLFKHIRGYRLSRYQDLAEDMLCCIRQIVEYFFANKHIAIDDPIQDGKSALELAFLYDYKRPGTESMDILVDGQGRPLLHLAFKRRLFAIFRIFLSPSTGCWAWRESPRMKYLLIEDKQGNTIFNIVSQEVKRLKDPKSWEAPHYRITLQYLRVIS
ncbi:hypothetical protein OQA88_4368 [Cercophora sp. LCS_1]